MQGIACYRRSHFGYRVAPLKTSVHIAFMTLSNGPDPICLLIPKVCTISHLGRPDAQMHFAKSIPNTRTYSVTIILLVSLQGVLTSTAFYFPSICGKEKKTHRYHRLTFNLLFVILVQIITSLLGYWVLLSETLVNIHHMSFNTEDIHCSENYFSLFLR